ncbi:MAG: serine protease [Rhodospirillales bacterium RIFCSPLOWO2_12_FULL_58_28]|nr:MAG: serine protease [Rhodospirillales bacterium RIFCSPLOWO2_02_FULL_58_16]OHC77758.1 MAG: serine protease [Rhodospirillales bacterium RIFCSPLOWO2_12_FULL_58_28]
METFAVNQVSAIVTLRRSALVKVAAVVMALAMPMAPSAAQAKATPDGFADMAEKLLPAVVNISTTQVVEGHVGPEMPQLPPGSPFEEFFKDFFERNRPQGEQGGPGGQPNRQRKATSLGSGFFIDAKGHVITNNHVIADSDEITVILQDNTRLKAEVVGRDPKTDIAVLKVDPIEGMVHADFGESDDARVGDWVIAIGNPFGLGGTVTAGIISARHRDINSGPYDDFIQTDASINRGNSGGPMFNIEGKVIGINSAIYSPSGGSVGIGFAIPSATAESVIKQLIKHGKVRRGWLGVHIQAVTPEIAETLNLEKAEGALVASIIKDGPAEKSDIKPGDVITGFDGKRIKEMRKLPRIVAETDIDKKVKVDLWRNGAKMVVEVDIGKLDDAEPKVASKDAGPEPKAEKETKIDALGMTMSAVSSAMRERFGIGGESKGVVVTAVDEAGPAAEKGIQPGDLVVEISQQEVTSPSEVVARIEEAVTAKRKTVLLLVESQGGLRFVALKLGKG